MFKFILIFSCFLLSFSVSAQFETGIKEYNGFRYKIRQQTQGQSITDSSIFQIQMKVFNSTDSLLGNTYMEDFPPIVDLNNNEQNREIPLAEVFRKVKIGDSLTVFLHTDSLFLEGQPRPNFIKKGSWIRQEFRIVRSYTPQEYEEVQVEIQKKRERDLSRTAIENRHNLDSISKKQIEYIENIFFVEKGIKNYQKTESGLFYVITEKGGFIPSEEKLRIHYKGTVLQSGKKIESSYDRGEPFEFIIGQSRVIQGWEEGIPLIGSGGKGTLYIPCHLAYQEEKRGSAIDPYSILIFEIEVIGDKIGGDFVSKDVYRIDDNQTDYIENVYLKLNDITDYKKTESGLFYRIEKQGVPIKKEEKLSIRYEENFLITGEKLISSHDTERVYEITIGLGYHIKGWEEGIPLIGKGGKGTLYIPAKLAYGKEEVGEQFESNAMLIYKIEVLEN